jgi:superoxide dismutase
MQLPLELCAGKHHKAYLDNMNKAIAGTDAENKTLEEVVVSSWNSGSPTPLFNNAAQVGGVHSGALRVCVGREGQGQASSQQ